MNCMSNNYSLYSLCVLFIGIQLSACTNRGSSSVNKITTISGRYVNYTFLDQIRNSIIGHIDVSCYEMNFISADSVAFNWNGWEEGYKCAYKKEGDHYRLFTRAFGADNDLLFTLNQDGSIVLADSTMMRRSLNSVFRHVDSEVSLDYLINQKTIAGTYTLFKNDEPTKVKVVFMPNGKVVGLEKFTRYSICYAGDCVQMPLTFSNVIDLYPDNYREHVHKESYLSDSGEVVHGLSTSIENPATMCAFTLEDNNEKIVKIYRLGNSPKDTKGDMPIKELLFDLRQ